jgi:hypothetical protein
MAALMATRGFSRRAFALAAPVARAPQRSCQLTGYCRASSVTAHRGVLAESDPRAAAGRAALEQQQRQRQPATRLSRRCASSSGGADEDIDVDSVAYGFMASQALFTGLETGAFSPGRHCHFGRK